MSNLIKAPLPKLPGGKVKPIGKIKSSILSWLGVPIDLMSGEFWAQYYGATSNSGETVTQNNALQLSAVWACVRLLSSTISTLPLVLYRKGPNDTRTVASDHPLYPLIHDNPNADMTAVQFWEAFCVSLLLPGMGFLEIVKIGTRIVSLDFLWPSRMAMRRLKDGSIEYKYIDLDGTTRIIPEQDIMAVPAFTMDGVTSLSVIRYATQVFGNAMATEKASGTLFANGMRIQGVFEFDHVVRENQRAAFEASLEKYRGAINAGKTPLLEAGIHYKNITMKAEDAELLASRGYSVEEICRWYGVPPFMVGHGEKSSSWPSSIEQQMIAFLVYSLRPWLKRIEQAINKRLLTPTERATLYAEFNIEGLLRGDSAARSSFYQIMTKAGIFTRNEVRKFENMGPMDGGEILTVEANMVGLAQLVPKDEDVDGTTDVQATALNGAQVTALQAILQSVADGKLPAETARATIAAAFPLLSEAQVAAMVNPLGAFEPTPDEPPAPPPGAPPPEDPDAPAA